MSTLWLMSVKPFEVGAVLRSRRRLVTEADFTTLINVTWENAPLHTDQQYMETTPFGGRILGGPCIIALAGGLSTEPLYLSWSLAGLDVIAGIGLDAVRYRSPLQPGDSIEVESEVTVLRPSESRPGELVATVHDRVLGDGERVILEMDRSYLLRRQTPSGDLGST